MLANRPRPAALALAWLILAAPAVAAAAEPIKVLVLSGSDDPVREEARPVLRRILERSGRFDVRVLESTASLSEKSFRGFNVIVDDDPSLDAEAAQRLGEFVESGKGLVVTGGGVARLSAVSEIAPLKAEARESSVATIQDVELTTPAHPILAGLAWDRRTVGPFPAAKVVGPGSEALAVAGPEKNPVLAAWSFGPSRIAATSLGRDAVGLSEPAIGEILERAVEWAATGAVTPKPSLAAPLRALLITGGHFHDASFYGLFDGIEGLGELPVETAAEAFKKDVREKFDVVVFYDFTRDLDEKARANLRAFVEAGKGVVVLHHALLDSQTWTWWSEEVVGGRYRLQREGDAPSSGVKDGVTMFITPQGEHPVLRGVGPFLVVDEAYKNLYHSEKNRPLLSSDSQASDPVVAWVGPSETARVVAIQLGHGPSAYTHPSYRKLVHNAVRWSARKID